MLAVPLRGARFNVEIEEEEFGILDLEEDNLYECRSCEMRYTVHTESSYEEPRYCPFCGEYHSIMDENREEEREEEE